MINEEPELLHPPAGLRRGRKRFVLHRSARVIQKVTSLLPRVIAFSPSSLFLLLAFIPVLSSLSRDPEEDR